MRAPWKFLTPALLSGGAALVFAAALVAQPPDRGRGDAAKKDDRQPDRRPVEKPDPAVEAWVKVLVEKITDPHDTIRDSARAGLVAVGREALPALRALAEGEDRAKAVAARKLIEAIASRDARPATPTRPFRFTDFDGALDELRLPDKLRQDAGSAVEKAKQQALALVKQSAGGGLSRQELLDATERVRAETLRELKGVLPADQYRRLENLLERRAPREAAPPPSTPRRDPPK